MTKEEFKQQMLNKVLYYKDKLDEAELRRAMLPKDICKDNITFNPFMKFNPEYFNKKILSNLQALDHVLYNNPEVSLYEIKMFIISNSEYKVLNQILKFKPYFVEELRDRTHSPMGIAIDYAQYCTQLNRMQKYKH